MDPRAALLEKLEQTRDEIISLCSNLVRIPSENPPGDTRDVCRFIASYLDARGVKYDVIAPQETMPNIVATVQGKEPGKHLVLNGHMDVFPAGDRTLWDRDPFSGEVADGKIHGRGVSDMKAGVTASLITFLYLKELKEHWKGSLSLTTVSDEETFGPWGTDYLLTNFPHLRGDAGLSGEPSSCDIMNFGEKGLLWIEIECRGRSAHAAYPHWGKNAIKEMTEILKRLEGIEQIPFTLPDEVVKNFEEARDELERIRGAGATDVLMKITTNMGIIQGGMKVNLIADYCRAEFDFRVPIGVPLERIEKEVEKILKEYETVRYRVITKSEPNFSSTTHEIFQIVQQNATEVRGQAPIFSSGLGGTDMRLFRRYGVPSAVYGPRTYGMGAPNEYITVADLLDVTKVHALTAYDYLTV
ncbi:MAG: ArgE/DapE family deacylase [Candidatus Tectomicrobia bacterium]|nr:ArgE/DapE family deacylase [Candidatus Tectomicrobia bacterium]